MAFRSVAWMDGKLAGHLAVNLVLNWVGQMDERMVDWRVCC